MRRRKCADEYRGKTKMKTSFIHRASGLIQKVVLLVLRGYKSYISPLFPPACRFEPTCSVYMCQAIQKKGLLRGILLGAKRLLRCHPFCAGGLDPVP
jgi:putative membrane protein insertion efficiency factor